VVKFFPAGRLGGLDTIESLAAPFPDIRFVPSGGIGPGNAAEYLASPSIFAISGSWMVSRELLARSDFTEVERLSLAAAAIARSRP
jgi:2-dehydro-3-deoxyphosphogluconate aldolase / (4S)-4-hydroxy-2-oxoglutarate aldolase